MKRLRESGYCGLISAEPGYGKGSPLDEPVLTPTGWTAMGDLKVGDEVVGSDGLSTTVLDVYDRGELPVYRVTFRDGSSVRVDGDHLWQVKSGRHETVVETRELLEWSRDRLVKYYIPQNPEVAHPEADLPIDPYLLGALIADGYLAAPKNTVQWTKNEQSVVDEMREACARQGVRLSGGERYDTAHQYGVTGMRQLVRDLGLDVLSGEKFIPVEYLTASVAQRWSLVNGLFDGDGKVRKSRGTARYSTVSNRLADDVLQLLWSLGVSATKTWMSHPRAGWWEVVIHSDHNPFKASGNRDLVTGGTRTLRRSFKSIEFEGYEQVRCIRVAADDHLYVTKDYIVTHNTVLAVAAMLEAGAEQVLVIAPDSTHMSAWDKTYHVLFEQPGHVRILGNKSKAQKEALADFEWGVAGWYVATPQFFTRAFNADWNPDAVIADEVHQYTNPGTRGQKHLSGRSRADRNPLSVRATYKLALSGTPARNKFERLWGVTRFLWPEEDGDFEVAEVPFSAWQKNRMRSEFNPFATSGRTYTTEILPGRLLREMPCVIQHKRRETCCEHHPGGFMPVAEPVVIEEVVDMTAKQKKTFTELESKGLAWLNDNPMVASLPITAQLRIRQAILGELSVEDYFDEKSEQVKQRVWFEPNAKSPHADRIEELLDSMGDEPVLVLTASKIFAKYLTARLNKRGDTARELTGDTIKTRAQDVREFGDEFRVAVAVIDAIGTGTDGLGDRCATEIWADRSLDRANNTQAEARLDRRGQSRRVVRHILRDSTGYSERQYTRQAIASAELDKSLRTK